MAKKNARPQNGKTSASEQRNHITNQMNLPGVELPPALPARFPSGRLEQIALHRLLAGEELRQDRFFESWRLAALIFSLSEKGWLCHKRQIDVAGRSRPITGYRLDMSAPSAKSALHRRISRGAA